MAYSLTHESECIHLVDFPPFFFHKGDYNTESLFAFLDIKALLKGVYSKRKEFALTGSKFFPFGVDPFSKEGKINFDRIVSLGSVFIPFNKQQCDKIYLPTYAPSKSSGLPSEAFCRPWLSTTMLSTSFRKSFFA